MCEEKASDSRIGVAAGMHFFSPCQDLDVCQINITTVRKRDDGSDDAGKGVCLAQPGRAQR